MNAKQRFDATLNRCSGLVSLHASHKNDDLLRAAVVFAVSAFDMYAADRFAEHFIPYIKSHEPTKRDDKFLSDIGFTAKETILMITHTRKRPFRRIRKVLDEYLSRKPMQTFSSVNKLYGYYGLKDIIARADRKKKSTKLSTIVEKLVHRRHEIVHAADYNGKNALKSIAERDVRKGIEALSILVSNMDFIICNSFSSRKSKKHP